jgi:hypothetical protein
MDGPGWFCSKSRLWMHLPNPCRRLGLIKTLAALRMKYDPRKLENSPHLKIGEFLVSGVIR